MLAAVGLAEGITVLTTLNQTDGPGPRFPMLMVLEAAGVPMLTALSPTKGFPILMVLHPAELLALAFLAALDPTKGLPVAFLTTPDAKAGSLVEVGHLSAQAQGSTEGDLNFRPNHHVRVGTTKRQMTATCSDTSKLPKDANSPPVATTSRNPPDGSRD
jgi:hypothetical protein